MTLVKHRQRRRVAVIGLPFFAQRAAEALRGAGYDARFVHQPQGPLAWPSIVTTIMTADLVYAIGSSVELRSPLHLISVAGKPIVMHWVGNDVQAALEAVAHGRASTRVLKRAVHWADAPWLADELEQIGVYASERLLPVPAVIGSPTPLPEEFRVLVYLPREFLGAYEVDSILRVVRALPDVRFTLVGGFTPAPAPPNLENLGFVRDMPSVYARSSALLRLTNHDGMSHSVIEALSFGRYVAWSYPLEGVTQIKDADEAVAYLRGLAARHAAGRLGPNELGARFVADRYDPAKMLKAVRLELDRLFC